MTGTPRWTGRSRWRATSWWHGRIVAGLASYWVYQHLGNLSPAERAEDEIWQRIVSHSGPGEPDVSDALDAFADRVDREPRTYRFSYRRDFGDIRLVVVDSRARDLTPTARALVDSTEWEWLDEQLRGGFRHLLVATSLPFLLPIGLHHVESWDEAISQGVWGRLAARIGERLRQMVDLEHWARGRTASRLAVLTEIADGGRGTARIRWPILSGDVHFSYIAEVDRSGGGRIVQAVCSPVRNPLPRLMRWFSVVMSYGLARPVGAVVARSAKVPILRSSGPRPKGPGSTTTSRCFGTLLEASRAHLAQGGRRESSRGTTLMRRGPRRRRAPARARRGGASRRGRSSGCRGTRASRSPTPRTATRAATSCRGR